MKDTLFMILGWILLLGGAAVLIWTLVFSYGIFSGGTEPFALFTPQEIATEEGSEQEEMIFRQISQFMPPEHIAMMMNLVAWTLFAGIAVFAGAKASSLGIAILKSNRSS